MRRVPRAVKSSPGRIFIKFLGSESPEVCSCTGGGHSDDLRALSLATSVTVDSDRTASFADAVTVAARRHWR